MDRLTAQLAVAQGAQSGERLAQLAAVTTTSLEALKAYLEGRSAYRANDLFAALPAFQRAVAADSSFALAWYGLAATASWMLRPALEQHAAQKAVRESGRLSARDRMLVEAFAAYSRGSADSAERMAASIVETYDDIEGWVLLGEVLYHHNWKRGRSLAESRRAWERVLALDASYWPALQHLSEVSALEGRRGDADSLLGRYERSVGTSHMMLASRALRAYAFGDNASRASLTPSLASDRGFFLIASVWYVGVYGRDVESAKRLAGMLVEPLRPPEQQGFGRVVLGVFSQYDGAPPRHGPRGIPGLIVTKRLTMRGFILYDFAAERDQALAELAGWVAKGQIKVPEDIIDGLEQTPAALIGGAGHSTSL